MLDQPEGRLFGGLGVVKVDFVVALGRDELAYALAVLPIGLLGVDGDCLEVITFLYFLLL